MSTWYWLTSHSFIVILLIWGQSYRYLKWMAVVLGEPNIKSFCSSKIWLGTPWISAWLVSRRSSGILTLASTITWSPSKKGKIKVLVFFSVKLKILGLQVFSFTYMTIGTTRSLLRQSIFDRKSLFSWIWSVKQSKNSPNYIGIAGQITVDQVQV